MSPRIDCLQYANWNRAVFEQMRAGELSAVHATLAYHENFRELTHNLIAWERRFLRHKDLIFAGAQAADVDAAMQSNRTAIFFGLQTPAPIEDDIGLVGICHRLGIRFMQLTYNNQSLLGSGCYEPQDGGISRFGREVLREMNTLGMAADLSHAGERTTLQAIQLSARPIAITHANPNWWHDCPRNVSHEVLSALSDSGGMLGLSLYPHHLAGGSDCTLADFCGMAAEAARRYGAHCIGIGSDLCQGQPDSVVQWMRNGRWRDGEDDEPVAFPPQLPWFASNADFGNIATGLAAAGLNAQETDGIMGGNWQRFFAAAFTPMAPRPA